MSSERSRETAQQLTRTTRQRFAESTEALFEPIGRAILERLEVAAQQVTNAREMQTHRDDFLAFRSREANWVNSARVQWRQMGRNAPSRGGVSAPSSSATLELIDDDAVELQILWSRLAMLIQEKVSFEFNDLRLRVLDLDGGTELGNGDVLRPETLARMLVDQWLATGLERTLWTRVQSLLAEQLIQGLLDAYKQANTLLIEKGVMPEIDLKRFVKRTGAVSSGSMPMTGGTAQATSSALGQFGDQQPGPTLMHAPPGFPGLGGRFAPAAIGVSAGGGRGRSAGEPGGQLVVGSSPLLAARQRAQGVLSSLKRFVTGRIGGGAFGGPADEATHAYTHRASSNDGSQAAGFISGTQATQTFYAAIAEAEAMYAGEASQYEQGQEVGLGAVQRTAARLRQRAAELKRKAPTTADKATVEVVALMFQAILAEERIPFSARVWFARLQMPVLRVAIAEPEFFATLQHPARMLIDRMGSCVMGFDAAAITGSALENEIRRVVQVIEQYPETGQRVFKLVYDEFVVFLSKYLTKSDSAQKVMSVAAQVEQKETMVIGYTIELRSMLDDMPVREEIRDFLFKVWAEVLAVAAMRYGPQDDRTVLLKRAASELVWAASAKPSRQERARVIQELPKLLQRLREGMALLGITGEPQEAHMKSIGDTLSDAFQSKTEAIAPAKIEAMARRLSNIEDFVSEQAEGDGTELPLDAPSIELLLGVDAASIEVVPNADTKVSEEMLEWARALEVGYWFMLDHNGRVSQVQFVWRSERKRLHLFASADGRSFLIQAGRLASYLQAGLLVPAEDESLTVRATREALAKLDANPERLLN